MPFLGQIAVEHAGGPEIAADLVRLAQQFLERFVLFGGNLDGPAGVFDIVGQAVDAVVIEAENPAGQRAAAAIHDGQHVVIAAALKQQPQGHHAPCRPFAGGVLLGGLHLATRTVLEVGGDPSHAHSMPHLP
jgi:hypothetical protein